VPSRACPRVSRWLPHPARPGRRRRPVARPSARQRQRLIRREDEVVASRTPRSYCDDPCRLHQSVFPRRPRSNANSRGGRCRNLEAVSSVAGRTLTREESQEPLPRRRRLPACQQPGDIPRDVREFADLGLNQHIGAQYPPRPPGRPTAPPDRPGSQPRMGPAAAGAAYPRGRSGGPSKPVGLEHRRRLHRRQPQ
jgi:hypothetical protein